MENWKKILINKPPTGSTQEEIENWKNGIRILREKEEIDYLEKMKKLEDQWSRKEWEEMKYLLNKLSLEQILWIANKVGIEFTGGNENITDTKNMTAKEQFIFVFDEVPREELMRYYNDVTDGQKEIIKIKNINDLNLLNAVIEIDEVEYLINKDGAEAIKSEDKTILLKRIIDGESSLISIDKIKKAIKDNGIIDYL